MDLYFYFTVSLGLLVAALVTWTFYTGKKLHSSVFKIMIIFFIMFSPSFAQEEDEDMIVVDDKPLVFPKEIPKAIEIINNESGTLVDYLSQEDTWRLMAYEFLYGNKTKPLGPKEIII